MTTATTPHTTTSKPFSVDLPEAFTPEWSRLDGITVDGTTVTVDPGQYFFRYESPSWLLVDWELVRSELLGAKETDEQAVEQRALEFVKAHGQVTHDPAKVLEVGYQVAAHLFRDEYLNIPGLDVTERELKALREATTIMALNRVETDGHISNVGSCWFFPVATSVVFGFDEDEARKVDELYHGGWFNETRRRESVLAHAALGGRLVHGCQASADMAGGCVLAYGTDLDGFRRELDSMRHDWMDKVAAMGRR
ncbi:hypothetical protein SMD44_p10207 (plasmid) [Streptomyces alboflavus]|uniref:Uncharacterized protein n=1 Tax=Streptomyces alboflavus TaxID=67267 RepID=A0A291W4X7_9ACTN|nr:hypothetical protein [Streptomyces alboflavus]ATM24706.1 hypothetical protein SMD44_p10207 [Streptomyces alboflavus]